MENPFLRRATELLRDDEAFLAIVSPEPVSYYLERPGKNGTLYDRLVLIRGTPGSGKTTLARLFEFPTLSTLLRNQSFSGHKDLFSALSTCAAIKDDRPYVLGCRLPLESDYRDFWEFPYPDELKTNLMTTLLQARTVLGWFRHLGSAGIDPGQVKLIMRPEAQGILDTIGGDKGEDIRKRAAEVENAIYKVMTSLVAPSESQLSPNVIAPFRPFDLIERFQIPGVTFGLPDPLDLLPLVILDDAHVLHPHQCQALERFLVRRELRVARWMIARIDVLLPEQALAAAMEDRSESNDFPGVSAARETVQIFMQSSGKRREQRTRFRVLAKDMATRYLRRMPFLNERNLTILGDMLDNHEVSVTPGRLKELQKKVSSTQERFRIADSQRTSFEMDIRTYWGDKTPLPEDIALGMQNVMLNRYALRRGEVQPSLFDNEDETKAKSPRPVVANPSVYEAARFQLFHEYERPYYFGIDDVCDASSENAELFLQLSGELVETIAMQVARSKKATITPGIQHKLLRERGAKIIEAWSFPDNDLVRRLVATVATLCLRKSLEPNGAVIANALGIPQVQIDTLAETNKVLARVLQFAIAYNAITLVPQYSQDHEQWCLLELGGMALLKYGLTLKRGGFIEGNVAQLAGFLQETNP